MTARRDIRPRDHADPRVSEAFRSAQEALDTIPPMSLWWLRDVVASGTAGAALPAITWPTDEPLPAFASIVRVAQVGYANSDVQLTSVSANHRVNSGRQLVLYEPGGLTSDTRYDLLVLFGGVS